MQITFENCILGLIENNPNREVKVLQINKDNSSYYSVNYYNLYSQHLQDLNKPIVSCENTKNDEYKIIL